MASIPYNDEQTIQSEVPHVDNDAGVAGPLLRIEITPGRGAELHMNGIAVTHRAVKWGMCQDDE